MFDADGNLLLRVSSTDGATLFLGDTTVTQAAGSSVVEGFRTYSGAEGKPVAQRSAKSGTAGSVLTWLFTILEGTVDVGWLLFLAVRGIVLWVLIPFAFLAWLLVHSWAQKASLGQAICWYDQNLNLALVKDPLRLLIGNEVDARFLGISQMRALATYRIRWSMEMV